MADAAAVTNAAPAFPAVVEMEKLLADQARLTNELTELQAEMKETLTMNDDLLVELNDKNALLLQREIKLKSLSDKDNTELQALQLDLDCTQDKYSYEISIRQQLLVDMDEKRRRYLRIKEENELLEQTVQDMSQELSNMDIQHALTIHEMNKDMSIVRQNLEISLRRELLQMDHKYQQRAFASLSENFKTDIFENAKLKDEVTLQSIGIANLTLRLQKQNFDADKYRKEIKVLNRQARALREALAELAVARQVENRTLEQTTEGLERLQEQHTSLLKQIQAPPEYHTLDTDIARCKNAIASERAKIRMWSARLRRVWDLDDTVIPTSVTEKRGIYTSSTFKISSSTIGKTALTNCMDAVPAGGGEVNPPETAEADGEGVRLADLEAAVANDSVLASALLLLKGKESILVSGKAKKPSGGARGVDKGAQEEEQTTNMVMWVVNEIMKIWQETTAAGLVTQSDLDAGLHASYATAEIPSDSGFTLTPIAEQTEFTGKEFDPFAMDTPLSPLALPDGIMPPEGLPIAEEQDPYLRFKAEQDALTTVASSLHQRVEEQGNSGNVSDEDDLRLRVGESDRQSGVLTGAGLVDSYRSASVSPSEELLAGHLYEDGEDGQGGTFERHLDDTIAVDDMLAELMQQEQQQVFDARLQEVVQKPWYRFRDIASRLPVGVTSGRTSFQSQFTYDEIRPPPQSFDLEPPVIVSRVRPDKAHAVAAASTGLSASASLSHLSTSKQLPTSAAGKPSRGGLNKAASQPAAAFIPANPRIIRSGSGLQLQMPATRRK